MRVEATAWLEHLDGARDLALAGEPEGVHQVRVSLRRLRVWLRFAKGARHLEKELRWGCRALAPLRDLDVFDRVLTTEARAALRTEAEDEAVAALESERWHALRAALNEVKPPRRKRARKALRRLEARLEALRETLEPGDGEALHRLRRALRMARYGREWLGEDAKALALEQEELGALCDLLALERFALQQQTEVPKPLRDAVLRGFTLLERQQGPQKLRPRSLG